MTAYMVYVFIGKVTQPICFYENEADAKAYAEKHFMRYQSIKIK